MENRVWIYASEKKISDQQKELIASELGPFLRDWLAHGLQLTADFEFLYDHILVIRANEAQFSASGCSIDKQIHFMKYLESKTDLSFFNRLLVAFEKDNEFFIYPSARVPELIEKNILSEDTLVFDFGVSTEKEFESRFRVPLKNTWLKKYLTVNK